MTRGKVAVAALAGLAGAVLLAGCVERRMVIRSQPEGARVLLDLAEVEGRTPLDVPYEWTGTRSVVLTAPGYEVLEGHVELEDRWYSYFPLDLFAELLYPGTIRDVQEFAFELTPYLPEDQAFTQEQEAQLERRISALRERADAYRKAGSAGPEGAAAAARRAPAAPGHAKEPQETAPERAPPAPRGGAPLPPPKPPRADG